MAEEHDALIRQVDEEVRRERLAKLWEKYGSLVIACAAIFVVSVLSYEWYRERKIATAEAAGARYERAAKLAQEGKSEDALKSFEEIAKSGPVGYAGLARIRAANSLSQSGKIAEAVAAYDALAKERSVDPLLTDYARLQAASLRLPQADWTEMQNRLNDLAGEKNAWRFSAREMLGLAAWKGGMLDDARKNYEQLLADRRVPPSIAERARIMMAQVVAAELAKAGGPSAAPVQATAPASEPGKDKAPPVAEKAKPAEKAGKDKR